MTERNKKIQASKIIIFLKAQLKLCVRVFVCVRLQIQNVGSGLCMEIKHFVSGSPIRLENCVKSRGEVGWSHGQVRPIQHSSSRDPAAMLHASRLLLQMYHQKAGWTCLRQG